MNSLFHINSINNHLKIQKKNIGGMLSCLNELFYGTSKSFLSCIFVNYILYNKKIVRKKNTPNIHSNYDFINL